MVHAIMLVGILLAAGSVLASLYILLFAIAGASIGRRSHSAQAGSEPLFLLMIPAHNEAAGIRFTIESALQVDYPHDRFRVVTIADNCEDETADVASHHGSEVWVRTDPENRGKGQALAWAFARALDTPFDAVVIIDADSEIDPMFLRNMAAEIDAGQMQSQMYALQGRYEFASTGEEAGWFETFTIASKAAENSFVYRPRSSARLVNLIQGNGFCLSRAVVEQVPFDASSVVEDAEYAITLALADVRVGYVDSARVISRMTRRIHDAAPQRLRWASGIFQLILRSVPKLVVQGIRRGNWKLVEAAVMLLLTSRLVVLYMTAAAFAIALVELPFGHARLILAVTHCGSAGAGLLSLAALSEIRAQALSHHRSALHAGLRRHHRHHSARGLVWVSAEALGANSSLSVPSGVTVIKPAQPVETEAPRSYQVSIVLPVRNEVQCLPGLLESLLQQEFPHDAFEVLVCDGGSTDGTREAVLRLAQSFPVHLALIDNPKVRSGPGRNAGVRSARGAIIVFLDGHCEIPSRTLLHDTVKLFEETDADCLCRPQPLLASLGSRQRQRIAATRASTLGHGRDSLIYNMEFAGYVDPASSGASYRREVFDAVGMYDERFDACEDVEFNTRLRKAGMKAYTDPRLAIFYEARGTVSALFRQMVRYGRGRVRLAAKHPDGISLTQFAPLVLLVVCALAPLAWTSGAAMRAALLFTPALYVLLVLANSVQLARAKGIEYLWHAPVIYAAIHFGLGAGMLLEGVDLCWSTLRGLGIRKRVAMQP